VRANGSISLKNDRGRDDHLFDIAGVGRSHWNRAVGIPVVSPHLVRWIRAATES
jgi:hypothetical protein